MKNVFFENLKIKNFLSIGEDELELEFKRGINLITGENKDSGGRNGIGKSSIIESIYWCLFGSTIRDLKKDKIIHNKSKNNCQVYLSFKVKTNNSEDNYRINRSLEPSKLCVYKNNEDITLSTIQKTDELIKNIIGANEQVFQNAVIMTANNTIPFMAQKKVDKRKFIEGIFNIEIFGEMLLKVRSDLNESKKVYDKNTAEFLLNKSNINDYKNQKKRNIDEKQKSIDHLKRNIDSNNAKISELSDTASVARTLSEHVTKRKLITEKLESLEVGLEKINQIISDKEREIMQSDFDLKKILDELEFHKKQTGTCPTCKRKYDPNHSFNEEDFKELESKLKDIEEDNRALKKVLKDSKDKKNIIVNFISQKKQEENQHETYIQDINKDIKKLDTIKEHNDQLLQTIKVIEDQKDSLDDIIDGAEKKSLVYESEIQEIQKRLSILEKCKFVVSEEGVKTYIIKKMLKIFNQQLNYYLKCLDTPCTCSFDEMFEETIYNSNNKECSYFNFSGGERKRIDIAILFMFQDILRSQTGVCFNLSMYDELFDSAIDEKGVNKVLEILAQRSEKYEESIYIVSHNKSALSYGYQSILQLQKTNGATHLVTI
jgi:DNA repair exonuclease SbcCD ATPase subunit